MTLTARSMTLIAAALLALAIWLATNARTGSKNHHRGKQVAGAVVLVAAANIVLLLFAYHAHYTAAQLVAIATAITLVVAVHRWAASMASR